jgi:predicted dehydrogenase
VPKENKDWHRRLLIVGCGSIGKRHTRNLLDLGVKDLVAFDVRPERLKEVSTLGVETVNRLELAWEYHPDAVIVAVPTSLHTTVALEAAFRRCQFFVEKPLSNCLDSVDRLLSVVQGSALITLVGCNMRFHPGLVTIKNLLQEGAVGRVLAARVEAGQYLPDWHPWEDYRQSYSACSRLGGGVILDAIHEIDYIHWLLGDVVSAACLAGKLSQLEIDTEDLAAMLLRFESGAIGEVHLDYVQRAYSRTCQLIGEEGTIHWDYAAGEVRWYSAHTKQWQVFSDPPHWNSNQMYVDEMKHFLNCLAGTERPMVDVFGAARVLQIALAAKASAQQLRWVELEGQIWQGSATL